MSEARLSLDTVRWLLAHMDDTVALAGSPELADVPGLRELSPYDRANAARTLLLDCIEVLRPSRRGAHRPDDARAYNVLWLRYVEGMGVLQVGDELALSERQTYRELRAAEAKLAEVLAARLQAIQPPPAAADPADDSTLMSVAARPALITLQALLERATATVAPLAESVGVSIRAAAIPPEGTAFADEGILRQWVIQALSLALQATTGEQVALTARQAGRDTTVTASFLAPDISPNRDALEGLHRLAGALRAHLEVTGGGDDPVCLTLTLPQAQVRTLLVVEDSQAAVELYRRYLEPLGQWRVIAASDAQSAFDLAREAQPAVILLDLLMPGTDGWTILNLLHANEDTKHIPVIVCSVFHDALLAEALGAKAHLRKPVSQAELLAAVNQWVR